MLLLNNMRQFVRQPSVAGVRPHLILASGKDHVPAHSVGAGVDSLGRCGRFPICMHVDLAEVLAEARFYESTGSRVMRPTGGAQHVLDNR